MDKFAPQRSRILDEISDYSGQDPVPCKSVGITLKYPTYSDLTPDQLAYYTYWKSTVGRRGFKKAADGYTWLLVTELLNSNDPDHASSRLNALVSATANDGSPLYPELLGTAVVYSKINGTPMPPCPARNDLNVLNCLLEPEISDIPAEILRSLSGDPSSFKEQNAGKLFGTVLRRYDRLLAEKKGTSLLDLCMVPSKTSFVPFTEYAVAAAPKPVELIEWRVAPFAGEFFAYLSKLPDGGDADIPFKAELRSMYKEVRASGEFTDSPDPFSKPEGVRIRTLGSAVTAYGPSRLCDPAVPNGSGKGTTLGEILTFSSKPPQRPEHYVPSGFEHPTYNDLSREQFAYFQYWKDCFRRGKFLDTDNGYVNLFLTEIINSSDTAEASSSLHTLQRIYGEGSPNLIGVTLMDHTVMNGGTFSDYRVYMDKLVVNSWVGDFVHGIDEVPMDERMLNILRSGSVNVRYMDPVPLEPFSASLKRIFAAIEAKSGIDSVLGVQEVAASRTFYIGLDYLRARKERAVRYRNYLGCRKFIGFMDKAAKYASNLVKNNCSQESRKPFTFGGVGCAVIFYEEFLLWQTKSEKPAEREIELDLDAVKAAEEDLRQVTDMMRTEEAPEEEEAATKQEEKPADDPWSQFFSVLTAREREYISLCLNDSQRTNAFLLETGITRVKMEDAINAKALDTVGDTVVEDGTPVEDYEEELRKGSE